MSPTGRCCKPERNYEILLYMKLLLYCYELLVTELYQNEKYIPLYDFETAQSY